MEAILMLTDGSNNRVNKGPICLWKMEWQSFAIVSASIIALFHTFEWNLFVQSDNWWGEIGVWGFC